MAPAAEATNHVERTGDRRHPAAARVWDREPEWVPSTPSTIELGGGIAGGLFGALWGPIIAGPVRAALSGLGPQDRTLGVDPAEVGDPGWFGPTSTAWRVHADPSLLIAGIAAFTLQSLHPLAMAGVAEHSAFSDDFLGRTRRTGEFVQGVVYGSSARAQHLCDMVRRVHRPVVGISPDGRPYAANDPELLDWVHLAEYLAIVSANRRFAVEPLSRDEMDTYLAEVARVGEATGVADPPRSWSAALASLEAHRPDLAVGEYAAAGIAFLDDPPIIPGPAKPVWNSLWAGATACLPPVARRLLRLPMPSGLELARCRAILRVLDNIGGDPIDLAQAKLRLSS